MILRAAWVVPVDGPPMRDGYVRVAGREIAEVGPWSGRAGPSDPNPPRQAGGRDAGAGPVLGAPGSDPVINLGDVILTPGLVNPHTHLELTCYTGRLPPAPFWDWLPALVPLRFAPGQVEREQRGAYDGAWQSLRAGVTCVGDISRRNLSWSVLKPLPLRKVCFVELLSLADQAPRNLAELRAGVAEVQEDELLTAGVTPHAPYTVPAEELCGAVRLAAELDRPWCTHWAETPEECAFLRTAGSLHPFLDALLAQCNIRAPRRPPLDFLEECCRDCPPGALAHYNYPDPGDAARLARAGHVVMYCPRAHRFFQHRPHPYRDLMAAGVTVALGTDSSASNEDLALLKEAQYLRQNDGDAPPPETLLRMMTLDAARALRLDGRIGSLTPGKCADLAAFPCPPRVDDPVAWLVDHAPTPTHVWVNGERVM